MTHGLLGLQEQEHLWHVFGRLQPFDGKCLFHSAKGEEGKGGGASPPERLGWRGERRGVCGSWVPKIATFFQPLFSRIVGFFEVGAHGGTSTKKRIDTNDVIDLTRPNSKSGFSKRK